MPFVQPCLALVVAVAAAAQPELEPVPEAPSGITAAANAYVEGVLDGDARRVQDAAHELLAKRRVAHEYWGQPSREWVRGITREQLPGLVDYFQTAGMVSPADASPEIEVLSWTPTTAAVSARSGAGLQLLHLALIGDSWLVVDDAYDLDPTPAQRNDDRAVRNVISDYARGIYERAEIKTLGSCHTSVAKRDVADGPTGAMLNAMSYEELGLFAETYNAYWGFQPKNARRDIKVLAIVDSIASVRLDGENWTDFIHVAKVNGSWLIIDILTTPSETK